MLWCCLEPWERNTCSCWNWRRAVCDPQLAAEGKCIYEWALALLLLFPHGFAHAPSPSQQYLLLLRNNLLRMVTAMATESDFLDSVVVTAEAERVGQLCVEGDAPKSVRRCREAAERICCSVSAGSQRSAKSLQPVDFAAPCPPQ